MHVPAANLTALRFFYNKLSRAWRIVFAAPVSYAAMCFNGHTSSRTVSYTQYFVGVPCEEGTRFYL